MMRTRNTSGSLVITYVEHYYKKKSDEQIATYDVSTVTYRPYQTPGSRQCRNLISSNEPSNTTNLTPIGHRNPPHRLISPPPPYVCIACVSFFLSGINHQTGHVDLQKPTTRSSSCEWQDLRVPRTTRPSPCPLRSLPSARRWSTWPSGADDP